MSRSRQIFRARPSPSSRCRGTALERFASIPQKLCLAPSRRALHHAHGGGARARGASRQLQVEQFAIGGRLFERVRTEAKLEDSVQGVDHV